MKISMTQLGKRFKYEWIFRELDFEFQNHGKYAILGSNGSGKSTLMKILSGHLSPSKGKIEHVVDGQNISIQEVYKSVSFVAPYIDLIEELTLKEALDFHQKFKPFLHGLDTTQALEIINLPERAKFKEIRHFSSGMKQRLKLSLALMSNSSLLLLDEPTTNLDVEGVNWYHNLIYEFGKERTIIVASNDERDYTFCQHFLDITNYKKK